MTKRSSGPSTRPPVDKRRRHQQHQQQQKEEEEAYQQQYLQLQQEPSLGANRSTFSPSSSSVASSRVTNVSADFWESPPSLALAGSQLRAFHRWIDDACDASVAFAATSVAADRQASPIRLERQQLQQLKDDHLEPPPPRRPRSYEPEQKQQQQWKSSSRTNGHRGGDGAGGDSDGVDALPLLRASRRPMKHCSQTPPTTKAEMLELLAECKAYVRGNPVLLVLGAQIVYVCADTCACGEQESGRRVVILCH